MVTKKVASKGKDVVSDVVKIADAGIAGLTEAHEKLTKASKEPEKRKKKLSDKQKETLLVSQEAKIKKGLKAFLTVCAAIRVIAADELYRIRGFSKLADYCRSEFGFDKTETSRYHKAGRIIRELKSKGFTSLPENEGQTRVLAKLWQKPEKLAEVWREVVDREEPITAKLIADVVAAHATTTQGSADQESPAPPKFADCKIVASIIVKDEDAAKFVVEKFAEHDGPRTHRDGKEVRVGLLAASELNVMLDWFDDVLADSLTLKLVRQ